MSCLPKPVLRGHMKRSGLISIFGALAFGSIAAAGYYFSVAVPRKEAYLNFLKTYDAEAHYKDLVKWGYINLAKELQNKESK